MDVAVKLSLLSSGIFLLFGMISGVIKYQFIITSKDSRAPTYIDIAHRASFLYSFAALVIAKLLEFSPYTVTVKLVICGVPLAFFALTIMGYLITGLKNKTDNMFATKNFITTWFMYLLIVGEIGGMVLIVWGFISTQFL
ncbi:MAG: hypothetical protein WAQ98_21045 [Blastocatellia bacterium]